MNIKIKIAICVALLPVVWALQIPRDLHQRVAEARAGTAHGGSDNIPEEQRVDEAARDLGYGYQDPDYASDPDRRDTVEERAEREIRRVRNLAIAHHTLHPPFLQAFASGLQHWSFGDATVVTDKYIRLTPHKQGQSGYLWNNYKNELPEWEVHLSIDARSRGGVGGDGMAFWYTRERPTTSGPILGHPQGFHGVGVLFDSYDNDGKRDNPSVRIIFNSQSKITHFDPSLDFASDDEGYQNQGGTQTHCMFDFRNTLAPDTVVARIRYRDGTIDVFMSHGHKTDEVPCATMSVQLPVGYYFGFTGETGGVADNQDVRYFHVTPLTDPVSLRDNGEHSLEDHQYDHSVEHQDKHYWRKKTPEEEAEESEREKMREQANRDQTAETNPTRDESERELDGDEPASTDRDPPTHDYRRERLHREMPHPPPAAPVGHAERIHREEELRREEERHRQEKEDERRKAEEERKRQDEERKRQEDEAQRRKEEDATRKRVEEDRRREEEEEHAREVLRQAEERKKRHNDEQMQKEEQERHASAAEAAKQADEEAKRAAEAAKEAQRKAEEAHRAELKAEEREREAQKKRQDVKMRARRGNTPV